MKRLLSLSVFAAIFAGSFSAQSADLKQSKFTQVVNDVQVIAMPEKSQKPAAANELFKLPDIIRTGPASRCEMIADDKTITRVGANTVFSFNAATRTIDLEKGSLLFHSPKGKGGGTIKSGSATAAVLGTTIMVASTPDGGFKVVVLEGTAKIKVNNGQTQTLHAGQTVFVLPGGQMSPVITFRLDMLVNASQLVRGFDAPLPSMDLINIEIDKQNQLLKEGKIEDTGLLLGIGATETTVETVDPNNLPPNFFGKFSPAALGLDAIINAPKLEQAHLFLTPTEVSGLPFSGTFVGFFARDISFVNGSQTVDLSPYGNLQTFTFLASRDIHIENSVNFSGGETFSGDVALLAAGTITIASGSTLDYYGSGFFVQALGSLSFDSVTFRNGNGVMEISSGGTLAMKSSTILGYGVTLGGASGLSLDDVFASGYGSVGFRPSGAQVTQTSFGQLDISSGGGISIKSSSFEGSQITVSGSSINVSANSSFYGSSLSMAAANAINISDTSFGLNTINMAAKTIILKNVDFSSSSYVYLQCKLGALADNPNTGASPVAGKVNFISGVTYGGDAAQNHVNPISGSGIFISAIGQSQTPASARFAFGGQSHTFNYAPNLNTGTAGQIIRTTQNLK